MNQQPTRGIPYYSANGRFIGWECGTCFAKGEYSGAWDSFACLNCEHWLDAPCRCKSEECPYANRPEKPDFFDTPFGKSLC